MRARSRPPLAQAARRRQPGRGRTGSLDELSGLFELDVANLALVEDEGGAPPHFRAGRWPGQRQLIGQSVSLSQRHLASAPSCARVPSRSTTRRALRREQALNDIASRAAPSSVRARGDVIGVIFAVGPPSRPFELDDSVMETSRRAVSRSSERAPRMLSRRTRAGTADRDLARCAVASRPRRAAQRRGSGDGKGCACRALLHPPGEPGEPTPAGGMGGARSPALVEASRLPAVNLRLASAAPWRSATCSTRLSWTIRRLGTSASSLIAIAPCWRLHRRVRSGDRVLGLHWAGLRLDRPDLLAEAVALEAAIAID